MYNRGQLSLCAGLTLVNIPVGHGWNTTSREGYHNLSFLTWNEKLHVTAPVLLASSCALPWFKCLYRSMCIISYPVCWIKWCFLGFTVDLQWRWDCRRAPNKKFLVWSREKGEKLCRKEKNAGHELVILSPAYGLHASKTLAGKGLIKENAKVRLSQVLALWELLGLQREGKAGGALKCHGDFSVTEHSSRKAVLMKRRKKDVYTQLLPDNTKILKSYVKLFSPR